MSQFNAPLYDIARPTGQCAFTGKTIQPGEAFIATLVEEGSSFKRLDVSIEAWEEGKRPEHLFSYWKAVLPEPNQKRKLFVDDQVLLDLLGRLSSATEPQRVAFRFVLTLILMRKKLLRYNKTERRVAAVGEGQSVEQEWWLLSPKLDVSKGPMSKWNDEVVIDVLDPRLDDAKIQEVTEQLGQILQAEL